MYDDFRLSGKARGYRIPGAKLLPQCAFDAARCRESKTTARQLRRDDAEECRVMGYGRRKLEPHERRVQRLRKRLSTRALKRVDSLFQASPHFTPIKGARTQERLLAHLEHYWIIEEIRDTDQRLLRNAY